MQRPPLVALALLATVLAGCGGSPPAKTAVDEPDGAAELEDLDLVATKDTGILRGVVVDAAIRPLAGVRVRLAGLDQGMDTTASGLFGFDGLEAGEYVVQAEKAGFLPVQTTVAVVVGDDSPPFSRLLLQANGSYQAPYVEVSQITGYIQCTGSPMALCGIPNNYRPTACGTHDALCYPAVTEDRALFQLEALGNVSFLQAELVWQASSDLTRTLAWNHVAGMGCAGLEGHNNVTHGESPLQAPLVPREVRVPGGDVCTMFLAVTAGPPTEAACLPVPVPLFNTLCFGVAVNQAFDIYLHAFYGYLPPEGWTFVADGTPPPPR